jgi:hypothetical protein
MLRRILWLSGCIGETEPIKANDNTILAKQRRVLQNYSFQFSGNIRIIRYYEAFMKAIKIFISSVQREFAEERWALSNYLSNDPLMSRFFQFFLFEDIPANNRKADKLYVLEVMDSDIYIGLFGDEYGIENKDSLLPIGIYTSNASVQVMLFADRFEAWNPGELPSKLTLEKIKETHGSFPVNPLISEPLYLTKYIE